MPEFKNKEEYEKWKAMKSKETIAIQDKQTPAPLKKEDSSRKLPIGLMAVILFVGIIGTVIIMTLLSSRNSSTSGTLNVVNKAIGRGIDIAKFEPLMRAANKVKASTSVGVNFNQFGQYLQDYATEVAMIKGKISTDKETEILRQFNAALEIYNDSKVIWNCKINDSVTTEFESKGLQPEDFWINEDVAAIAQKYNLEVKENPKLGKKISINSMQLLWAQANKLIDTATTSVSRS